MSNGDSQTDFYYNAKGERVFLKRDTSVFSVRYKPGKKSDDLGTTAKARRFLRDESEHIDYLAHYNLQVYQFKVRDPERMVPELRSLNTEDAVEFATPAYRRSEHPEDLVLLSNRFVVEFKQGITDQEAEQHLQAFKTQYGIRVVERLGYTAPCIGYVLEAPQGVGESGPVALAQRFYETKLFRYAMPDLIQYRARRNGPASAPGTQNRTSRLDLSLTERSDWDYHSQQWHLDKAKIPAAWDQHTRGNPAITIAVADDGVDVGHPEFNGKIQKMYDFQLNVPDGTPKNAIDKHGTACAGITVALGLHASGAAPSCSLMVARFPDMLGVADEAKMFQWMADQGADVISCSWGPPDGTGASYPIPDNVASAIRYCITKGRKGKGIPIFWAAGNGNELVSTDGYASNPDVMAVAASTERDTKAYYSDFGPEICVCAPSSGSQTDGDRRIFTTDRLGAEGYNSGGSLSLGDMDGNYTNDFGGTSAAAPLVAGIAGLMLSANPDLAWYQVRDLLMQTADKIGEGYDAKGHSDYFGHGRVNALEAVRASATAAPVKISIEGPESTQRTSQPPRFTISLPPNRFYAVEVASEPRLFNGRQYAGQRTPANFYATWQDSGFLSSPQYQLSVPAWERLRNTDRLYYRMWVNSSATQWDTYFATVPSDQPEAAPYIKIEAEDAVTTISGPPAYVRSQGPPTFQISLPPNRYYAVEVTTSAQLFYAAQYRTQRDESNFFASWGNPGLLSAKPYQLPLAVWDRLKSAGRLYYRMWTSSSASQWVDASPSTADTQYVGAPYITVVDS